MPQSSKTRILVVDDNAMTRESLTKLLLLLPNVDVVGVATSGHEALEQATQAQPNVVLLDLTLPDEDGLNVAEALRSRLPHTHSILMSNEGAAHYLTMPLAQTVRAILIKPITLETLTKAVRHTSQW